MGNLLYINKEVSNRLKYKSIMLHADSGAEQINRCIELESKDKEIKDVKIQNSQLPPT